MFLVDTAVENIILSFLGERIEDILLQRKVNKKAKELGDWAKSNIFQANSGIVSGEGGIGKTIFLFHYTRYLPEKDYRKDLI